MAVPEKQVVFSERSTMEQMQVLYEFLTKGIDPEDMNYLKRSYDSMLASDSAGYWLNDTHWVEHCDILSMQFGNLNYFNFDFVLLFLSHFLHYISYLFDNISLTPLYLLTCRHLQLRSVNEMKFEFTPQAVQELKVIIRWTLRRR